jgi:rhodanese-related sulfurtransferase
MVVLNALPCEYYGKDHIPNSYNLPYKTARKMTEKEVDAWMREVIALHYPKLEKMALHEVPILTYCAHSGCHASELLVQELQKRGYVNLFEFKGGMKEWRGCD